MEAQRITISLHDESAGYDISPGRVPLAMLRTFANDVYDFVRGEGPGAESAGVEVGVVGGSLGIQTAPIADPGLLADLRHSQSPSSSIRSTRADAAWSSDGRRLLAAHARPVSKFRHQCFRSRW